MRYGNVTWRVWYVIGIEQKMLATWRHLFALYLPEY